MPTFASLSDVLSADGAQQRLVDDTRDLIDAQLDSKSGISATVLKGAYKVVTTLASGYYESLLGDLTPAFLGKLQPYWTDFQSAGGGQFGDYLAGRGDEVSQALLSVTDGAAQASEKAIVVKAYNTVRDGAAEHIKAALPALGTLVEKYAA